MWAGFYTLTLKNATSESWTSLFTYLHRITFLLKRSLRFTAWSPQQHTERALQTWVICWFFSISDRGLSEDFSYLQWPVPACSALGWNSGTVICTWVISLLAHSKHCWTIPFSYLPLQLRALWMTRCTASMGSCCYPRGTSVLPLVLRVCVKAAVWHIS